MAKLEVLEGLAQTEIIVIPIIDVSGSMSGERIGAVNDAMREVPGQLLDINDDSLEAELLIAPMEFSSGARWFNLTGNKPSKVDSFRWIDMKASGLTDLGAAFKLLNEKLTTEEKGGWMKGRGGAAPVIILISDGGPTDDYQKELAQLKKRGWFRAALKFAVAVSEADKSVLAEFTGNSEAVIDTEVIRKDLASIIKTVVVSASRTVSSNVSVSSQENNNDRIVTEEGPELDEQVQQEAIDNIKDQLTIDDSDDFF